MRTTLRAVSARLIVGHLDRQEAEDLLTVVDVRGKPLIFALAEPDGLGARMPVAAGVRGDGQAEPVRWGKLVLETVAHETVASPRADLCDAIVDGLRVAHRRLGFEGLELIPRGSSGVGFSAVAIVGHNAEIVVVPPAQVFVVHQGLALSVPESDEVGRGIWMRDDLRAEIFAGIGGAHEPDIRIYEAEIGPGDSLVLVSSSLTRMLTEEDVRRAVTYEEAAIGAERLKELAIQRGADAGVALVIEIAASLEAESQAEPASEPAGPGRPALHLEMPPIGSVFSTARDWLLEAVDRAQSTSAPPSPHLSTEEDEEIPWPVRPRRGEWRNRPLPPAPDRAPTVAAPQPDEAGDALVQPASEKPEDTWQPPVSSRAFMPSPTHASPAVEPALPMTRGDALISSVARPVETAKAKRGVYRPASREDRMARFGFGSRSQGQRPAERLGGSRGDRSRPDLRQLASRAQQTIVDGAAAAGSRLSAVDLSAKRRLVVPVLSLLIVLLLVVMGIRTVRAQQGRQLQQRFDSLINAAGQLEAQARSTTDHAQAQSLIQRAQALVDQAGTLEAHQSRVAVLRKDLQSDLDRLDNVVVLPDPVVTASFGNSGKNISASMLAGGSAGFFILDSGGNRVLQLPPRQQNPTPAATKGDKSGPNQLGDPRLLTANNGQALILDSNRNLWSYDPSKNALEQIGLKSSDTWKEATAMAAYGPNVYILDAALGNIFRYASRDGAFTDAPTRFLAKEDTALLGHGVSLAIDGSIWVLTSDGQILKMEGGASQPFSISGLPQPFGKASQIYTNADEHALYVLDSANNRIVQLGKDGHYLQQYNLSLPKPATGFWPDEAGHQLYVLTADNLYQYALPNS